MVSKAESKDGEDLCMNNLLFYTLKNESFVSLCSYVTFVSAAETQKMLEDMVAYDMFCIKTDITWETEDVGLVMGSHNNKKK